MTDQDTTREPLLADPYDGTRQAAAKDPEQRLSRRRVYLRHLTAILVTLVTFCFACMASRPYPDPFHKLKNGRIMYFTQDTDEGERIYLRDITAPCMYGILTFQVAPAALNLPYTFDLYNSHYYYKDAICPLKPTRTIHSSSPTPFLNTNDPTSVKAQFNYITRISSKMVHPANAKTNVPSKVLAEYAGDFVVVAAGDFYSADVYQQIEGIVHNWTETSTGSLENHLMKELNLF